MARFLRFFGTQLKQLRAQVPLPQSRIGRLMAVLSALGLASLGYLYGAAVMFFQMPSHDFLNETFTGANAWYERGRSLIVTKERETCARVIVDEADKTYDGFTLYTTTDGSSATLLDMRATVVHRWELPFRQAWPQASHVEDPLPDERIHWSHCYLYPNGDLLAIYHADSDANGDTPYGYGLVKLDKDSKLLWSYAGRVHHDLDVAEDGTIYTLAQNVIREPPAGLEFLPTPFLTDSLVFLSAEGQKLETIPLLDAFAQSPYAAILTSIPKHSTTKNPGDNPPQARSQPDLTVKGDLLHTNSVKVLSRALAPKFPLFKAGQVLLSVRNLDTVAVLDRSTRRIAWAAQGIWQLQHDAEFLDNGHLLLYDNLGSPKGTRILEYDPLTQAIPWVYANENSHPFRARFHGAKQRLPNGNTLIVNPDNRRLFEVTRDKELVWESVCPLPLDSQGWPRQDHAISGARRYTADELTFLKGVSRPRW
jgi:hypothetical protein